MKRTFAAERRKKKGTLDPFDPSAMLVHPESRLRNTVKISRASKSKSSQEGLEDDGEYTSEPLEVPDSEEVSESVDENSNDEASDYEDDDAQPRRSTRTAALRKTVKQLPFSPLKRRSARYRNRSFPDESEDELALFQRAGSDVELVAPRRSDRARKSVKDNLADSSAYEDDESDDEDEDEVVRKPKLAKKPVVRKASRPAYGHFRPIKDLGYDEDPDTAVLRAHRDVCEKCHKKPTHILLANHRKRPKNKAKRKKKDSSDEEDDEEKLARKGGWVRWSVLWKEKFELECLTNSASVSSVPSRHTGDVWLPSSATKFLGRPGTETERSGDRTSISTMQAPAARPTKPTSRRSVLALSTRRLLNLFA